MNIKHSDLGYIRYKQLDWYGHVRRMNTERLTQKRKKERKEKWDGIHLEEEEKEALEILRCRK